MSDTPALYAALYQPPLPGQAAQADTGAAPPSSGPAPAVRGPLVAIAAEFSPRYEQHRADLVSIDIRGLSRLLGTPRTIGAELRRESAARGVRVHVAVAPTRMAALVMAVARPGLTVIPSGGVADALAPVPLAVLEQLHEEAPPAGGSAAQARIRGEEAREAIAALKRWGLRTLGELAALPSADLSARLGRGGRAWQAIARGEDTRPLVPIEPEERFEGTLELEWPIEGAEPLSFVLTRLLEPLSTRLERRDRGAAVLHVELGLVTRDVHARRLELPSPLRDVRALRTLALLDLESHPPSAAIDRVTVTIEPTPGRILQHALFTRPHPTPEQLSTLLARLGAVVGQDRVGAPAMVDSFRPGAFAMTPFAIEHPPVPAAKGSGAGTAGASTEWASTESASADSPPPAAGVQAPAGVLRRCRQPVPARVGVDDAQRPVRVSTDRRGFAGGAVVSCAGPWRTSGAWWEEDTRQGQPSEPRMRNWKEDVPPDEPPRRREAGPWSRDEWDVALGDGAVYRLFRDRSTDGWFIDGVLD